jgi:hypothetical protein
MNRMKKLIAGVLGIGLLAVGLSVKAHAYTDAIMADNTAQITITIRPNVNRLVTITTDNVNMDLGLVDLTGDFVSTQTVSPATVTIGGTFGNTDLLLSANISGGWTFDGSSDTIDSDALATWVTFTSTNVAATPSQTGSYFDGTVLADDKDLIAVDAVDYPSIRVGNNSGTLDGRFEDNSTSMNGMLVGNERHMWMMFRMPSATTVADEQNITFVLTVEQGS